MTTLATLIDNCEADLDDSGNVTWSAADVERWCRDAIADYSEHFPLTDSSTINCSNNTRRYDLSVNVTDVLVVEYPDGQDPPEFLKKRSQHHPYFWQEDGYFDVEFHGDAGDAPELLISTKPSTGQDIVVTFQARHDNTITTATAITVPLEHEHILRNYVMWRAVLQLKAAEEASPTSNSSLLMSQFAINVDRARRAYTDALAKALFAESKSAVIGWTDQDNAVDRIY